MYVDCCKIVEFEESFVPISTNDLTSSKLNYQLAKFIVLFNDSITVVKLLADDSERTLPDPSFEDKEVTNETSAIEENPQQ